MAKARPWTIMLLRPDYAAATFGHDCYRALVTGATAARALKKARAAACEEDERPPECAEDYYCLSCVEGHHRDYHDGEGGVLDDRDTR